VTNTDFEWIGITAFTVDDDTPRVTVNAISDEDPAATEMSTSHDGVAYETDAGEGHNYSLDWDALQTWCDAYPSDGAMCGGYLDDTPPEELEVTLRIRAYNDEGNHFFIDHPVTILRGEDLYAYTCDGSCDGRSPTGCYCDSVCWRYMDCCPDVTEMCEHDYGCLGRPWCS